MDDDQVKYQEKVEVTEEVHQFGKREEHDSVDVEKVGHQDLSHDLQEGTRRNLRTRHGKDACFHHRYLHRDSLFNLFHFLTFKVVMIALGGCNSRNITPER